MNLSDGEILVRHARSIVASHLRGTNLEKLDSKFSSPSGVFVTLYRYNHLRGCIGYPDADKPLSDALKDAAVSAATQDPRFSPVTLDELDAITFEVTILSMPEKITVTDPRDYTSHIKVGRDGLIIRHMGRSGLLLPQVPTEYGWNETEFLEYTCEKAGLEKDAWLQNNTRVYKFEGIVFGEETPNGRIIQKHV